MACPWYAGKSGLQLSHDPESPFWASPFNNRQPSPALTATGLLGRIIWKDATTVLFAVLETLKRHPVP